MMTLNKFIAIGNLTRSPELRFSTNGTPIMTFSLAINRRYKQGDEVKDEVCFIDCVEFGKSAETHVQVIDKGHKIVIEGRLQQQRWESEDGKKNSKHVVVIESITYLNRKDESHGV